MLHREIQQPRKKKPALRTSSPHPSPSSSFFDEKNRAIAALEYTNQQIEEIEKTLELMRLKKHQLENFMKKEGCLC